MTASIHLGYEIGTGAAVEIPLRHMAVTGQTQESGKTTTLEALITRSSLRAIAYVTKRGESSFHVAKSIRPYFQERADWKFVQSLLEAAMERRMDFKEPWIMRASDGATTLEEVQKNIQRFLHGVSEKRGRSKKESWLIKPARGLERDVYYVLSKYFDEIMPQIHDLPYTTELELAAGVNVMDLRDYEFPLQALVVRSVIDYVKENEENTINVIPEAWKFAPKVKGSPVRQSAEELIREGGALKNFLWIDSQDLAGVADVLMRQVGVWIFGVQRAKHEIERALDHMPEGLPQRRPRPQDIATLNKGQFYVCYGREMLKVYVQPAWMTAAHAEAIARGEEDVDSAREILHKFSAKRPKKADELERYHGPRGKLLKLNVDEEEKVWKEKYEALKKEFDTLREAHDAMAREKASAAASPTKGVIKGMPPAAADIFNGTSLDWLYENIRQRALSDPRILQLLTQQPELRIKLERPVLEVDGASLFGRMAQLVAEGFFATPKTYTAATDEAIRRGWCAAKTPKMRSQEYLDRLASKGFLTREAEGYLTTGAKVTTETA